MKTDTSDDDNCLVDTFYKDLQASGNDSDSDDDKDIDVEDDDIGAVFGETREMYKHELSQTLPDYTKAVSKEVSVRDIEAAIDNIPQTDKINNEDQSNDKICANCCTKKRVDNACSFKRGQHIRLPGQYSSFNFGKKLRKLYNHHAIVKQIKKADDQKVELVLIHLTKVGKDINFHETSETFDLAHDEIYIVEYLHPRYKADDVVERAESMLPIDWLYFGKHRYGTFYNVFTCNCEHFASWCVVGENECFASKSVLKTIAEILSKGTGIGCKICECEKIPVLKLSDLNLGSMITFNYFGLQHFAIVTEVHEENEDSTIGTIRCVHYGLKSLNIFRKRHVMEEFIRFDLNKASKKLKMVDCRHLNCYPSHQVVQRVKQRVGETNWNAVSNRSDHLCFWALVKEENELENSNTNADNTGNIGETKTKHKSSLCTGQTEVHVRGEVRLGDVVKYAGANGIAVYLEDKSQCEAQEFEIELMVYRNYNVIREKKTVNLRQKRLFVKNYHPAHCCSMRDRIQRACEKENTKCNYWLEESFFESCILKNI